LKIAAAGSVGAVSLATKPKTVAAQAHQPINGPLANAVVSFGSWQTDPPLNRFPNVSVAARNQHQQIPRTATIKRGGTVNFIIAGLHQIVVYRPGTRPEDINAPVTTPTTGTPAGVPLINDPNNRVYFGLDPSLLPRDRVEVVHFHNPGLYLVICGVQSHFYDGMFGFVRVLEGDDE
jgi:hypothetical protein